MPTAQQLIAERDRLQALIASNRATLAQQEQTLAEARARNLSQNTIDAFQRSVDQTQSLVNAQENLLRVNNLQLAQANQPTTSNPPNPQVPSAPAATPAPTSTAASQITDYTFEDNASLGYASPPATQSVPLTRVEIQPQTVAAVDATPPLPGISAPVDGLSPYGEADEPIDPNFVTQPDPSLFSPNYYTQDIVDDFDPVPQEQDNGFSPYGEENDPPNLVEAASPATAGNYTAYYDVETGKWNVRDDNTGADVYTGLTEQQAILKEQDLNAGSVGYYYGTDEQVQEADNPSDPNAVQQQATLAAARQQQILRDQQKQVNQGDWRVKLRLAPGATYLYDDPSGPGILAPLSTSSGTGGVVFPYTPQIQMSYNANYNSYDLTHSNYRGYFYQGSNVSEVQLQAKFTAQDTKEAGYLLAVIHFFRSVTKMFYGANDAYAGTPPPLVFLEGFGEYQFNRHPMVVSQFNYTLPDDVDYIRANSPNISSTNIQYKRDLQTLPTDAFSSAWARLQSAFLPAGAINSTPPPVPTFGTNSPTYVPTAINISLILLPMQTRQQVSQNFNLKSFANGQLIKGGFW